MLNYITKTTILLVTLLLPTTILAQDCDSSCEIKNKQAESLKSAGIKPLTAIKISPVTAADSSAKSKSKQSPTIATQPFEIPPPGDAEVKDTKSKNKSTPFMFNNTQPNQEGSGENTATQETTETTSTQQPTGIQYR